jgi:hypothetical protein
MGKKRDSTLARLEAAGLTRYAITGSSALPASVREAADLDLVVNSFAELPVALGETFRCVHVHPSAAPGKMLLQLVHPDDRIRVDIFGAAGNTLARTIPGTLEGHSVRFVSQEDLAARLARSLMALERGKPVPQKFATDFRTLVDAIERSQIEAAWGDHRADDDPETFDEACNRIAMVLAVSDDLLVEPQYSTDVDVLCSRCDASSGFSIASPREILGLLGYC